MGAKVSLDFVQSLDLQGFSGLKVLDIEDQAQLTALDISPLRQLKHLRINNAKNLLRLDGLEAVPPLQSLFINKTQIALAELLSAQVVKIAELSLATGKPQTR